jgi:hypothetical protein
MTTKTDYSDEEWQLLLDVPTLTGLAVMMSGKSGLGTMKEAVSLTRGALDGAKEHPNIELIKAIVDARVKGGEKSSAESFTDNPYQGLGVEKFMGIVLEKCRSASEVLARKATTEEATAFRSWVLSIADNVSKAAREGGFLGFGGTQVSAEEVAAINSIKSALTA